MATEILVKANFKPLIDANKQAADLKKTLGEIDKTEIGVKVSGLDKFHQYNRAIQQSVDEYMQDINRRSTWRDKYKLTEKPVNANEISEWERQRAGNTAGNVGNDVVRLLKYGTALWGGMSILSMIRESWEKYKQQSEAETGLAVRGVRFERRISGWNYSPQEEAEAAMGLRRATGANDTETLNRMERFARLTNIDMNSALGFAGGYYQATGVDPNKQRQAIDALLFMGKQAKDGRSEQLLQLINANLLTAQQAQGGRALTSAQASTVMAQTTGMYNAPGTMGFTSNLFNTMQNALMPGGDPTSELLKWDIIGGFEGRMTPERIVELQRRRNRGLNDQENLRRAIAGARRYSNSKAGQIMYMQMIMNSFGQKGGVDVAEAILDNYHTLSRARIGGAGDINKSIERLNGIYHGTPGFKVGKRTAIREFAKIEAGEGLEKVVGPFEEWVLSGSAEVLKAGGIAFDAKNRTSQYDDYIIKSAARYGISPAWVKSVINAETGGRFDRFAVSPKGAKGLMQIMPKTGKDLGLLSDRDFFNPQKNIDAGTHYLSSLYRQTSGDMAKATIAYNEGLSKAQKGIIEPETKNYLTKVMRGTGVADLSFASNEQYQQLTQANQSLRAPAIRPDLAEEVVNLLREISNKVGKINIAPGASGALGAPLPVGPK